MDFDGFLKCGFRWLQHLKVFFKQKASGPALYIKPHTATTSIGYSTDIQMKMKVKV
jgi:hypothetical protein